MPSPASTSRNEPLRAARKLPSPQAPAAGHLDFLERRTRAVLSVVSPSLDDPEVVRRLMELHSASRQLGEERDRLVAAGHDLERVPADESLQFLIDLQHLLLDHVEERRTLTAIATQVADLWVQLAARLLAQELIPFIEFYPIVDQLEVLIRRLKPERASESWATLMTPLRLAVRKRAWPSRLPDPALAVGVLADALSAAGQAALALPSTLLRPANFPHILCGLLFRDVGWLALLHHQRATRIRGQSRQVWLYAQHAAVGTGIWDTVPNVPLLVRTIVGGHHERSNGRGLRRWPGSRITEELAFVAAAARLVELLRLSHRAPEIAVANLRAETEQGLWAVEAVEALVASGSLLSPLEREPDWEADHEGRLRILHEQHPELRGPHVVSPDRTASPLKTAAMKSSR